MYEVYFNFYGNPYTVYVSPESLRDDFPDPASVDGPSELFDSFNSILDDDEGGIWDAIREACKEADEIEKMKEELRKIAIPEAVRGGKNTKQ